MVLLKIHDLCVSYDGIEALRGVSLAVDDRQIATLVGANGAGKSTLLRALSGMIRPSRGTICFAGRSIVQLPAHEIAIAGISHVPEGRRVFARLTIDENLSMGAFARRDRRRVAQDRERVLNLFPRLRERARQVAGTLSGGEQQMLAMARALMARPKLLLLDEPSMGLAPVVVEQVFDAISSINAEGVTVLLVEQNAAMALAMADRAYVLESGRLVLSGRGSELLDNDAVQRAYLG